MLAVLSLGVLAVSWSVLAVVTALRIGSRAVTFSARILRRSRPLFSGARRAVVASTSAAASTSRSVRRSASRWRRSRRLSAVLAGMLSVAIFGGIVPVNAAAGDISTFAGRPDSGDGGAATSALIHVPRDVATDAAGNLYVADTYNHRIRKVTTSGTTTTIAGNGTSGFSGDGGPATAAQLRFPQGVWVDSTGNLYIADSGNHRVRLVTPGGTISTVAGTGTAGFSGDGGPATAARLNDPKDITTDAAGNLYIADNENHRVRRVGGAGIITTYAGNGVEGYAGDGGLATAARLNDPTGLAFNNTADQLYIADTDNHRIRRVNPSGIIENYVGTGTAGSNNHPQINKSAVNLPQRLSYANGGLYFADTGNHRVRFITNSVVYTAGDGTAGFGGDGGPATAAQLHTPTGVAALSGGLVYIADSANHRVRRVSSTGTITTYAGRNHYGGDGGNATDANLNRPSGVATDGAGNVYIADWENHRIRRVAGGTITTIAGTGVEGAAGDGGLATAAQLNDPLDVAVDSSGNIYVADTGNNKVRKIDAAGTITTFAGTGTFGFAGDGGPATSAQLRNPYGVEVDAAGYVYIADTLNHRIRRVAPDGTITTIAGSGSGMFCGDGGAATSACLEDPLDVAIASNGTMYIADYNNHRVRSVVSGTIRTVAGNGSPSYGGDGGAATSASLSSPGGVEVDPAGAVLIADSGNSRIRRVSPSGTITTVGGNGAFGFAGDGGPAVAGELAFPLHIALDPSGNLFTADLYNNRVRMIESVGLLPGPTMSGTTPASPANDNTPLVRGTATAGTTVRLYTDSLCVGPIAATGGASTFGSPGLEVTVADDSTTSFYATSTDASGNVSACSSSPVIYLEDSTAPAAPTITLRPASPGSDKSPTWSFTTDAGANAECEISRDGIPVIPYSACPSPATFDLSAEPDGTYRLSVRATDAAGNLGPASTDDYVLDSTQPAAVEFTSVPASPSSGRSPTWTFTVEAGSTAECELSHDGVLVDPFATCSSPLTIDLTGDPNGTYTLRVQARDAAGNPSAPVSSSYVLDTIDPAAPTIDQAPAGPSNSTAPAWSFTVEAGSTAQCQLSRGGTVVSGWQACPSPKAYDLSGEPDGTYEFSVRAVDAAGNIGAATSGSYTLDTTGPSASIGSSPASPSSDTNPSWTFSAEAGSTLECELRRDASVVSPWAPCSSPTSHNLAAQPDGAYTFSVRARDAVGNTGDPASNTYVFDTTAPVVEVTSAPAPVSSERNPEWSFATESGATSECELSGPTGVLQAFASCTSPRSYDLTGQADGTYTIALRATDQAGNLGPSTVSSYTLDTSGPASSITSSPSTPGSSRSVQWGFGVEAGATAECEVLSTSGVLSPYAPCTSPASYDLTGQADGPFTFSVRATDAAGNVGAPASQTYTLDTTAPGAPTITSSAASPSNLASVSWSFSAEGGTSTQCELSRGGAVVSGWSSCSSPATYSLSADGDYTFRVRATDGAGNTGAAASSSYTLDRSAPAVTIQAPSSPGNDRSPRWALSTESGAALECRLSSGGTTPPFTACTSPFTTGLAGQPDGAYELAARATDAAGNTGPVASATYVLDTSAPDVTIVSAPVSPGSGTAASWAFATEAGASTECELSRDGGTVQAFASCSSPAAYTLSGGDGAYTLRVRGRDAAGNTGAAATSTYVLDRTPPGAPAITSSPRSPATQRSVSWSFTAEAGAVTECELVRDTATIQPFGLCADTAAFDLAGKADGDYTFRVRALDGLGNASAAAASTYALDTTGPIVTFTSQPGTLGDRNPTWRFSVEAGATSECSVTRGAVVLSPPAPCVSPVSFDLGAEPDGTFTIKVRATDVAGNTGPVATSSYDLKTVVEEPEPQEPAPAPKTVEEAPSLEPEAEPVDAGTDVPLREREPKDEPKEEEEAGEIIPAAEAVQTTGGNGGRGVLDEVLENVSTVVAGVLEEPAFPMILICLVVTFLVLQNRVDRRDPKLALAPVYPDPHMYFDPQDEPSTGR